MFHKSLTAVIFWTSNNILICVFTSSVRK